MMMMMNRRIQIHQETEPVFPDLKLFGARYDQHSLLARRTSLPAVANPSAFTRHAAARLSTADAAALFPVPLVRGFVARERQCGADRQRTPCH